MSTSDQPRRGTPTDPWFVVNATEQPWKAAAGLGALREVRGPDGERWPQYGFNIHVMAPGDVTTMYHGEGAQEDFLVLSGTCLAFVEGEESR